jgi:hypothetical protein
MAFQSSGFQGTAFQMRRQDQRRPGSVVLSWHDGVRRDKRIIDNWAKREDEELVLIARAFVDNVLKA